MRDELQDELDAVWEQIAYNIKHRLPTSDLYETVAEIVRYRTNIYYVIGE